MLPPTSMGKITYIAEEGTYDLETTVCEVEFMGKRFNYQMSHKWPVR